MDTPHPSPTHPRTKPLAHRRSTRPVEDDGSPSTAPVESPESSEPTPTIARIRQALFAFFYQFLKAVFGDVRRRTWYRISLEIDEEIDPKKGFPKEIKDRLDEVLRWESYGPSVKSAIIFSGRYVRSLVFKAASLTVLILSMAAVLGFMWWYRWETHIELREQSAAHALKKAEEAEDEAEQLAQENSELETQKKALEEELETNQSNHRDALVSIQHGLEGFLRSFEPHGSNVDVQLEDRISPTISSGTNDSSMAAEIGTLTATLTAQGGDTGTTWMHINTTNRADKSAIIAISHFGPFFATGKANQFEPSSFVDKSSADLARELVKVTTQAGHGTLEELVVIGHEDGLWEHLVAKTKRSEVLAKARAQFFAESFVYPAGIPADKVTIVSHGEEILDGDCLCSFADVLHGHDGDTHLSSTKLDVSYFDDNWSKLAQEHDDLTFTLGADGSLRNIFGEEWFGDSRYEHADIARYIAHCDEIWNMLFANQEGRCGDYPTRYRNGELAMTEWEEQIRNDEELREDCKRVLRRARSVVLIGIYSTEGAPES